MTGVAAQMCADRLEVNQLGYRIDSQDNIINESGKPFSRLGARNVVLNDLAPIATFIAKNYNRPVQSEIFAIHAQDVLNSTEDEIKKIVDSKLKIINQKINKKRRKSPSHNYLKQKFKRL